MNRDNVLNEPRQASIIGPEISIFLEPYRAVYIEVPKVACTSLKVAFAQLLGIPLDEAGGNPHEVVFPAPPTSLSHSGQFYPGLFSFGFVRNPRDRLLSCYRDKIGGEVDGFTEFTDRPGVANCLAQFDVFEAGMSFEGFVEAVASIPDEEADAHFRSQFTFLANQMGEIAVDFVGRYECLNADFDLVRQMIGLPYVQLPRLQAARSRVQYGDYFSPATRKIVAERFAMDIELFRYVF